MLHEFGVQLQTKLRARGCPVAVVDGPEPTGTATWGRERIVVEHDGDGFSNTRSVHKNPPHRMIRNVGTRITIYAQSTRAKALPFEHENRAAAILDAVLVGIVDVAASGAEAPFNAYAINAGRFFVPPDLEGTERRGGAAYELSVTFERPVVEQSFQGEIAEEVAVGGENGIGVSNTVLASLDGEDTEIVIPSEA